ncbi:EmrB/QacA subfamily drug resistance transporter [Kribbella steppae]|uniref:EmrB/QacA subfamily drug resistance transporter n=1 Tax=Kribbella steppae TaxID=2512223 RepID=A0A4R2HTD4_9ACTN|nr:MFS transporter [Kribbella steppae]TCO34584.1 EmrB/QacA subfamily drug resistance transporter [Kribbella steppae]
MPGSSSSPRLTLAVLATVVAAFSMLQSLVSPALPVIQRDLGTTAGTVTWVFTALLLSVSVATPLLGRIGDMVGKERTLLIALAALAVGCLLAAIAPNIGVLIGARVVQGLGGAVFPLAFGIIRDEFPPERVPSVVGVLSAVIAVGGGLGIVLAGPIVEALGWRWLFWIPLVVVTLAAVMARRYVPESPQRVPGRIDWLAAALLSGWLVALLLPLSAGRSWGWGSLSTIGLFVAAAVLLVGWITVELRSRNPLIDMRMMRLPAVWTTNLVALLFGAAMFAVYAFVPQFMQIPTVAGFGFGSSVSQAGLLMLPMLVTMAVSGSLSGPIAPWFSVKAQVVWGSALSLVASVAFAEFHDQPWQVAIATAVFGLGLGLAYASMTSLIVQNVPREQTGAATGMSANIRTIGGSIGTAIASSIITGHVQTSGLPAESGFTDTFLLLAAFCAVAVLLALAIPRARRVTATPEPVLEELVG